MTGVIFLCYINCSKHFFKMYYTKSVRAIMQGYVFYEIKCVPIIHFIGPPGSVVGHLRVIPKVIFYVETESSHIIGPPRQNYFITSDFLSNLKNYYKIKTKTKTVEYKKYFSINTPKPLNSEPKP